MKIEKYKELIPVYDFTDEDRTLGQITYNSFEEKFNEKEEQKLRYYLFRKGLGIKHTYSCQEDPIKPSGIEGFPLDSFISEFMNEKNIKKLEIAPITELFNGEDNIIEYGLVADYDHLHGEEEFIDCIIVSSPLYSEYSELPELTKLVNSHPSPYSMEWYSSQINPYYVQPCNCGAEVIVIKYYGRRYTVDE